MIMTHNWFMWFHSNWTMPEYKCYWRAVNPDTKVAVAFGLLAARRYGTDMTLWQGLQGRGDPYRTLLREGTTAFLNSHNSLQFPYNAIGVIQRMNWALMGSNRNVLLTALRFRRANSGYGQVSCKFNPCEWFISWHYRIYMWTASDWVYVVILFVGLYVLYYYFSFCNTASWTGKF